LRILIFGDSFISVEDFQRAFSKISKTNQVTFMHLNEQDHMIPQTESEKSIKEYLGSTKQIVSVLNDEEILVVHGAPVTEEVFSAARNLKVLCCARGGPVNIDLMAATKKGIPDVTAPGKNAEAVAELTFALMILLSRNIIKAHRHVIETKIVGKDNYEGNQFFGQELDGKTLGLIGYGQVGSRVGKRARSFGMSVIVFDPYIERSKIEAPGIMAVDLETLLINSDYISLHARESKENENLIGAKQFSMMKQGAYFINTARPSLVDEKALFDALRRGKLAGSGVDVVRYDPARPVNPLIELENVIVLPHIAGATHESKAKGAFIVAKQIERYLSGQSLQTVINSEVLTRK
jgi:phosphoglycerate dehydrogenase-like enzyme